jgi:ABC-type enterobactin transport system permease subunit
MTNSRKVYSPEIVLIIAGLMVIVIVFVLAQRSPMPDFIRGSITGIGIGLEIIGLISVIRNKKTTTTGC